MSGKAKQNRDEAEVQFLGVRRGILHACETKPLIRRAVTRKVAELEASWNKLLKTHTLYCTTAGIGLGSAESCEFIDKNANLKEEAIQTAETLLGDNEEEDATLVGKRLKRSVELLIAEVEYTIPTLNGFTSDELDSEAHDEALSMVQESLDKMKRYVELGEKAEEVLDTTTADDLRKSVSEAHKNHGTKLLEVKRLILKNSPAKITVEPKFNIVGCISS